MAISVIPAQTGIHFESRSTHGFPSPQEWRWYVLTFVTIAIEAQGLVERLKIPDHVESPRDARFSL